MPGGSLLAGLGLMASELFKYNRENYKFDKDQMLERELMRVEMQVKRFELFREDIRDLVDLTVDRMDVYHLVGALFLEFCVVFFCEGRVQASAPPFLLSLFLLSNACSFVFLLLAVWLSMHASIASHSFGVRILTRFVRLPIPSASQIRGLTSNLAGFEFQGLTQMLRLPFVQAPEQQWSQNSTLHNSNETVAQAGEEATTGEQQPRAAAAEALGPPVAAAHVPLPAWTADQPAAPEQPTAAPAVREAEEDVQNNAEDNQAANQNELLGDGDRPFDDEHLLLRGASMPDRHVQLFRRLQAKWQCYDAYCRVCMTLGVNQILQGLTYFAICHTLVENRSPSCGYALMLIFQAVALALARLDISGLHKWQVLAVQSVGTLPAFLAAGAVHAAERDEDGALEPHEDYPSSPYMFFLQACWLELLLWVAAPSRDDAALPRRFRSVLFLDVFGDAEDPFEAEHRPNEVNPTAVNDHGGRAALRQLAAERVVAAESALEIAQAALRRWNAVPQPSLTTNQSQELSRARSELMLWRRALWGEVAWRAAVDGLPHPGAAWQEELGGAAVQPWGELTPHEREEDPFAHTLIGPLEHDTGYEVSLFYYDVERATYSWEENPQRGVLTLGEVTMAVRALEASTRLLLGTAEAGETEEQERAAAAESTAEAGDTANLEACTGARQGLRGLLAAGLRAVQRIPLSEARDIELAEHLDRPLLRQSSGGSPQSGRRRGARHRGLDRVQLAAAGPHARHFVPERLPWQLMRGVTRVLQLCWIFVGMMAVLREIGLYRIDFQQPKGKGRRLTARAPAPAQSPAAAWESPLQGLRPPSHEVWSFESVDVFWPHRLFFRPTALFCPQIPVGQIQPPGAHADGVSSGALIGSPFAFYKVQSAESGRMHLEALPNASFPPETVVFCSASSTSSPRDSAAPRHGCLLGSLRSDGLAIWHAGEASANSSLLQLAGRPWKLVAGAVLACSSAARMLGAEAADAPTPDARVAKEKWCLLLAGWDGKRLPVAVVPLPGGPAEPPAAAGAVLSVAPSFDVPLSPAPSCAAPGVATAGAATCSRGPGHSEGLAASHAVVALHVEPIHGRLWALHEDGALQAWKLLPPAKLGRWQPRWPITAQGGASFEAAALCEDPNGGLLVVGRSEDVGAEMMRAELPAGFHP